MLILQKISKQEDHDINECIELLIEEALLNRGLCNKNNVNIDQNNLVEMVSDSGVSYKQNGNSRKEIQGTVDTKNEYDSEDIALARKIKALKILGLI